MNSIGLERLQTATINPARFLRLEALEDTIETGKQANPVLLNADPTLNIRNVDSVAAVILGAKLLTEPALEQMIARHPRANR